MVKIGAFVASVAKERKADPDTSLVVKVRRFILGVVCGCFSLVYGKG